MSTGRNHDKFISHDDSRRAILQGMLTANFTWDGERRGTPTSGVAYFAYPGYVFRSPQGAALAVSKLIRKMYDEGLIRRDFGKGYYLTMAGVAAAKDVAIAE